MGGAECGLAFGRNEQSVHFIINGHGKTGQTMCYSAEVYLFVTHFSIVP